MTPNMPSSGRVDVRRARALCYRVASILRRAGSYAAARQAITTARDVRRHDLAAITEPQS